MDRRKNSRSPPGTTGNVSVKLKSSHVAPTIASSQKQDTSIYEIDIHSSFDSQNIEVKEGDSAPLKVYVAKPASKTLETETKEKAEESNVPENPFMESYYPTFRVTPSDVKQTPVNSENKSNALGNEIREEMKGKRIFNEKGSKINRSPPVDFNSKFKNHMKNYIIENFISENDSAIKTLLQNYCGSLNNEQLHLHHHEHHHHYYFDDKMLPNGSDSPSLTLNKKLGGLQETASAAVSSCDRERKSQTGKNRAFENQEPKPAYYFRYPDESNTTFVKVLPSEKNQSTENAETLKIEKTNKIKTKKYSGPPATSCSKISSSVESIFYKKSDLLTTHIYSDTELSKIDNEETAVAEALEKESAKAKKSKKNSANDYSSLVNSLKSLNHFMSPVVITDQKTVPKISFIKCECTALKTLNPISNEWLAKDDNLAEDEVQEKPCTENVPEENEIPNKDPGIDRFFFLSKKKDKIENKLPITPEKSEREPLDDQVWTMKLKTELNEIKEELKRIEEKHVKKKKYLCLELNDIKVKGNSKNCHKVSVYSSKTFILGAKNIYVLKNCKGKPPEEEEEVKSVLSYKKTKRGHHFEFQAEREEASKKNRALLKEHSVSSHQVYSNRIYMISNKVLN